MATKDFIFQGVIASTHGDAIRKLFSVPKIQSVIITVAFITESGVQQIEGKLKAHAERLTVFAGIRNDITTHQGLSLLHKIGGTLYAVDTGSRTLLFHPKFFLVRGESSAAMVLGSANLTLGGLNNNLEAGLLLSFDLTDKADKAAVDQIETQLSALRKDHPDNVIKVTSATMLDEMLTSGRLIDEMAMPPPRPRTVARGGGSGDSVPRMKVKPTPIRRPLAKAKATPKVPKGSSSKTWSSRAEGHSGDGRSRI